MAAITVSRQLGSHGGRVARKLARTLGFELADKSTINQILSQYGLIRLDEIYGDKPPRIRELFDKDSIWTIEWMNKAIATIAATRDVVILGRGGYVVLEGHADVLNVLVKAPEAVRAERIGERDGLAAEQVLGKIEANDKTRNVFVRRFYGAKWGDESRFDLVVDTGELSDDEAVARVADAFQDHLATATGPRIKDLDVDPLLLETIDQVMGPRPA